MADGVLIRSKLSVRVVAATLVLLALAMVGVSMAYARIGQRLIGESISATAYERAGWIAQELQVTLGPDGKPTEATEGRMRHIAKGLDLSLVLFLQADTPLATAHGPSLTEALREFERHRADGETSDSGTTPFVPRFDDARDRDRFPNRFGRSVWVQESYPYAVETPVGRDMSLRVIPLQSPPLLSGGFRSALLTIYVLLALLALLIMGRAVRPVEELAREADRALRRSNHRVERSSVEEVDGIAQALNSLLQRLNRSRGQGRRVTESVAHGLVGLTRDLRQAADRIDDEAIPPTVRGQVTQMRRIGGSIADLVDDLALWTDLEVDRSKLSLADTDLRALLESNIAEVCARHGIEPSAFVLDVSDEIEDSLRVDGERVSVVLRHLLANGVLHGSAPVEISVTRGGNKIELSIRDHGEGIEDTDEQRRVLDPFVKGQGVDRIGLGLGLRIARRVIELHEGGFAMRNHPKGGLQVRLWLPAPPIRVSEIDRGLESADWNIPGSIEQEVGLDLVKSLVPQPKTQEDPRVTTGMFRGAPPPAGELSKPEPSTGDSSARPPEAEPTKPSEPAATPAPAPDESADDFEPDPPTQEPAAKKPARKVKSTSKKPARKRPAGSSEGSTTSAPHAPASEDDDDFEPF